MRRLNDLFNLIMKSLWPIVETASSAATPMSTSVVSSAPSHSVSDSDSVPVPVSDSITDSIPDSIPDSIFDSTVESIAESIADSVSCTKISLSEPTPASISIVAAETEVGTGVRSSAPLNSGSLTCSLSSVATDNNSAVCVSNDTHESLLEDTEEYKSAHNKDNKKDKEEEEQTEDEEEYSKEKAVTLGLIPRKEHHKEITKPQRRICQRCGSEVTRQRDSDPFECSRNNYHCTKDGRINRSACSWVLSEVGKAWADMGYSELPRDQSITLSRDEVVGRSLHRSGNMYGTGSSSNNNRSSGSSRGGGTSNSRSNSSSSSSSESSSGRSSGSSSGSSSRCRSGRKHGLNVDNDFSSCSRNHGSHSESTSDFRSSCIGKGSGHRSRAHNSSGKTYIGRDITRTNGRNRNDAACCWEKSSAPAPSGSGSNRSKGEAIAKSKLAMLAKLNTGSSSGSANGTGNNNTTTTNSSRSQSTHSNNSNNSNNKRMDSSSGQKALSKGERIAMEKLAMLSQLRNKK